MPTTITIMSDTFCSIQRALDEEPPFDHHCGKDSYFGGQPPLSEAVGYSVVVGFGLFFSLFTTVVMYINRYFGAKGDVTSEHFK